MEVLEFTVEIAILFRKILTFLTFEQTLSIIDVQMVEIFRKWKPKLF